MEGIFRALGFGSKPPEYAEKIPESLKAEDFRLYKTFHHGFPALPTCMDYDPLQQILAIGTESGAVLLLGKPGLEQYFKHSQRMAVLKLQFLINKGLLVSCCSNGVLYLWSLKGHEPKVIHQLEFVRTEEKPTCISHSYKSDWLYVGSEGSNVYVVHIPSFVLSGFIVHWDQALGMSARAKPGHVLAVLEHPMDQGKILIAYNGGHCVLYNMKQHIQQAGRATADARQPSDHKQFLHNPGNNHIITSVSWADCGRHFACSYSDGSIVLWNPKSEAKPEKIFFPHESDPSVFRPIYKLQALHTDSEAMYVCSGGFPENSSEAPRTLTVLHGRSSSMLSCSSTIVDFMCLPSSPFACDYQKPTMLVILSKNEVVFHDLSTPGYPRFPDYSLPYALDIHLPAVSSIHYSSLIPEEFIAQLHSVKSKMMTTFTKVWPLNGGRWGEEVPHSSTDIIITGHVDGSVRLWHCNSVIFQPFFTMDTSCYFKRRYEESHAPSTKSPGSGSKTSKSPTKSPTSNVSTPTKLTSPLSKLPPNRPPPPSHPPPKSRKASEKNLLRIKTPSNPSLEAEGSGGVGEVGEEVPASPATGQVHADTQSEQDHTDGSESAGERIQLSHKEKFKKSKKTKGSSSSSSNSSVDDPDHSPQNKKRSIKKSFHKMAKIVKTAAEKGRSVESVDSGETIPEEDEEGEGQGQQSSPPKETPLPPPTTQEGEQKPRKKRPPPRPSAIVLKDAPLSVESPKVTLTPSLTKEDATPGETAFDTRKLGSVDDAPRSPQQLSARQRSKIFSQESEDSFFVVKYLGMSVCGNWLCVANSGGCVMAFNFFGVGSKHTSQAGYLDVNFDYDSIKKQYIPGTGLDDLSPVTPWIYDSRVSDSTAGYQLGQLCSCFYTEVGSGPHSSPPSSPNGQSPSSLVDVIRRRMPVAINQVQYSVNIGLLALATRRGFAVVDTRNNSCVYILNCCTSILYLADPSKFASQMKRETRVAPARTRPSIKRHNTAIRLDTRTNLQSSRRRIQSAVNGHHHKSQSPEAGEEEGEEFYAEVMMEMDSCVSILELVQLQMDKLAPSMLTLWVGLASGFVAAYGVNVLKVPAAKFPGAGQAAKTPGVGPAKTPGVGKRIELMPTRLIIETKSPMVDMFFLNEWGDRQVAPYKMAAQMSGGRKANEPVLQRRPSQSPLSSPSTQHYAIFVDEQKMRSFSFPGLDKISAITLPLAENRFILRSQYFTCNELPCLVTFTSSQKVFIHSLPGLKQLLVISMSSVWEPQDVDNVGVASTFCVSGNGQGLYMSSPSEIQRVSIVKEDMLNFPECLPCVYTQRADVSPSNYGKGFLGLGALFSAGPTTINREEMFGSEAARSPIGTVAKVDGEICRAYGSKRMTRRERPSPDGAAGGPATDRPAGERSVYRKGAGNRKTVHSRDGGGGLSGQMNRNLVALDERKKKLGDIEDRTERVADEAANYADLAAQLARKYAK